jgi:DNA-binding transcriptional LysR family regulator
MKEIQLHRLDLNLLVVFEALMLEGSVVAAAEQLGKSPSAVSHALGRLREQVGDPLMVRVGGRMQPSPFALSLIEDVRPILRNIKRVMAAPESFDPQTSDRVFRVVMPSFSDTVVSTLERAREEAPGVRIEWLKPTSQIYAHVADGLIDLAHVGGELRLPEGLDAEEAATFTFMTFARHDHPAIADWGVAAWRKWPHLQVSIDTNTRSPVEQRPDQPESERKAAALITEFSGVAPVLARTDMLGTFPTIHMAGEIEKYRLRVLEPAILPEKFRSRFMWSSRLSNDAGNIWFRTLIMSIYAESQIRASEIIAKEKIILPNDSPK